MFAAQETSGTVVPLRVLVLFAQEHKLLGQCWLSALHACTTQAQHKNNIRPAPRVCFSGYLACVYILSPPATAPAKTSTQCGVEVSCLSQFSCVVNVVNRDPKKRDKLTHCWPNVGPAS